MNGCAIIDNIKGEYLTSKKDHSGNKDEVILKSTTNKISETNQKTFPANNSEFLQKNVDITKGTAIHQNSIEKKNEEKWLLDELNEKKNVPIKMERQLPVYGYVENVLLGPDNLKFKAKLDSGAKTSSLNALDIVEFERDGEQWVRFNMIDPSVGEKVELERKLENHVKIKQLGSESERRPVIMMEVQLGTIHIERKFSLTERNNFIYQVLLGRNFLNGVALIDVSRTFVANTSSDQE